MRNKRTRFGMTKCTLAQWEEFFPKHLWFAIVIVFLAEMGSGYLSVAGLNLLA